MSDNNTLDLTEITSEPVESNIQVEITDAPETEGTDTAGPEEPVESVEAGEEAAVEEEVSGAPVEEEEEPVEEEAPEETAGPVEEEAPVSTAPVEQVATDIRNILTEVPAVSTDSSELSDDLKQRIAELDYLRECCGNWVKTCRGGRSNFLTAWTNKSVSVDTNVNYEDKLNQLEKLPELIKEWSVQGPNKFRGKNYFKNIVSYTLSNPLFNDKNVTEKVEVLEQLVTLLTDCANGKMNKNQITDFIDNLY